MNNCRQLVLLVMVLSLSSIGIAQGQIEKTTPRNGPLKGGNPAAPIEERIVRIAYAKMALLDAAEKVSSAARRGDKSPITARERSLKFELSDFAIGDVSDIQNKQYTELVTPPNLEIIQAVMVTDTSKSEVQSGIMPRWVSGQYSSGFDPQWRISDVFQIEAVRFHAASRYAAYTVKVTLDGRSRTYNALAVFYNSDETRTKPDIIDSVVGMGGLLTKILAERRIPVGMKVKKIDRRGLQQQSVDGKSGENTSKSSTLVCVDWWWFEAPPLNELAGVKFFDGGYIPGDGGYWQCMEWAYAGGGGGVGGGGGGGQCNALNNPILHDQIYEMSTNSHDTGSHHARTRFQSVCSRDTACNTNCEVNLDTGAHGDTGTVSDYLYWHVGGSGITRRANTGGANQDVTCETAMGYAFKRCLLDCGVSVTVGVSGQGANASVTVSGGDLWNAGHIRDRSCRNGQ